jgi:hypothetical protein
MYIYKHIFVYVYIYKYLHVGDEKEELVTKVYIRIYACIVVYLYIYIYSHIEEMEAKEAVVTKVEVASVSSESLKDSIAKEVCFFYMCIYIYI